ncbi:MAG: dihydropteroate synthase [Thermoplasmata archaeon]|nr:dihydropteroate synthase [Thermoplasmata archaeon]
MIFPKGRGEPPLIMGILNLTPDSFSDGGRWNDTGRALMHAQDMIDQGADIIDVGAESTRPGCTPVSADEEWSRLEPVLRELRRTVDVPISVDTMKAEVAEKALSAGADIINDVNGLRGKGMIEICADNGAAVVISHMYGDYPDMHSDHMSGDYRNEIRGFLYTQSEKAVEAGISADRVIIDPGVGFGKTPEQNLGIIEDCSFLGDEYSILIGVSRKRIVSRTYPDMDADDATAILSKKAVDSGANIVRVHNVARTVSELRPL